jgi:hypothetical protein
MYSPVLNIKTDVHFMPKGELLGKSQLTCHTFSSWMSSTQVFLWFLGVLLHDNSERLLVVDSIYCEAFRQLDTFVHRRLLGSKG